MGHRKVILIQHSGLIINGLRFVPEGLEREDARKSLEVSEDR